MKQQISPFVPLDANHEPCHPPESSIIIFSLVLEHPTSDRGRGLFESCVMKTDFFMLTEGCLTDAAAADRNKINFRDDQTTVELAYSDCSCMCLINHNSLFHIRSLGGAAPPEPLRDIQVAVKLCKKQSK